MEKIKTIHYCKGGGVPNSIVMRDIPQPGDVLVIDGAKRTVVVTGVDFNKPQHNKAVTVDKSPWWADSKTPTNIRVTYEPKEGGFTTADRLAMCIQIMERTNDGETLLPWQLDVVHQAVNDQLDEVSRWDFLQIYTATLKLGVEGVQYV